jgi:branched-chain amino acid transport system substrate-binding protein
MKLARRTIVAALALGSIGLSAPLSAQQKPIRIGEFNSYTGAVALFTDTYRKGMDLALEHINASGGVLGRKIEVIHRDDNLSATDALRIANELVNSEKVDLITGTFASPIGMAVSNFATQNKVLFVAMEPLTNQITWEKGSRYTFRVASPVIGAANALAQRAAKLNCSRWAGIGPLSEAITDLHTDFRNELTRLGKNFTWTGEILNPQGKGNAGATIDALDRMNADCVVVSLIGPDIVGYIREAKIRGVYDKRTHLGLQTGSPEWLRSLGADAPTGWVVTGYPYESIDFPAHRKMVAEYQKKYGTEPGLGTIIGYLGMEAIAAGIKKAGALDVESLIKGFRATEFQSVIGPMRWRPDHQLEFGVWLGRVDLAPGAKTATLKDIVYVGKESLPTVEAGLKRRPAGAND